MYLRTSPRPHSRLDVNAQQVAIRALLSKGRAHLIDTLVEVEPLSSGARPKLEKAIALSKEHGATLIFGKFDRMRGGRRWLDRILEERIKVRAADLPQWTYAEFSRFVREDRHRCSGIGKKVKVALAAAKSRGMVLGGKRENISGLMDGPARSAESRSRTARIRAGGTMHLIELLRSGGASSLTDIATQLNEMGHRAPRGGNWSPAQVRRVIQNIAKIKAELANTDHA